MNEKTPNKYDKCVICHTDTEYDELDHVDRRYFYVEGAGQLCPKCYNQIHERKNAK